MAAAHHRPGDSGQSRRAFPLSRRAAQERRQRVAGAQRRRVDARAVAGAESQDAHAGSEESPPAVRPAAERHRRRHRHRAVGPAGRRGLRPAHRLRQPGQPAARPRRVAAEGIRHPLRPRRRPLAAAAAVHDRRDRAGAGRRRARHGARRRRAESDDRRESGEPAQGGGNHAGSGRSGLHAAHLGSHRRALRHGAAAAAARERREHLAEGSGAALDGRRGAREAAQRAGDARGRAGGRSRHRRGAAPAQPLEPDDGRRRLQAQSAGDVRPRAAAGAVPASHRAASISSSG